MIEAIKKEIKAVQQLMLNAPTSEKHDQLLGQIEGLSFALEIVTNPKHPMGLRILKRKEKERIITITNECLDCRKEFEYEITIPWAENGKDALFCVTQDNATHTNYCLNCRA
jgi:galactose-1-phosphate uridylyltransferase